MKSVFRRLLVVGICVAAASPAGLRAQEYFREAETPSQLAPVAPPTPEQIEKYNLKAGPVDLNIAAGVGIEWNDNINLAPAGQRESDLIVRPSLQLDATYPMTELNTLRFSLGVSYAAYLTHTEFDTRGVLLSPNSELALTVMVGQVQLTVRDRFSYQEDPLALPILSNVAVYRRFENQIGVQADWSMNQYVKFTVGYDHYNLWAMDSAFESLDENMDTIYVRPAVAITPAVTVGLNVSEGYIIFPHGNQNDGFATMVGPFVDITISQYTHLYAEAGYQGLTFSDHDVLPTQGVAFQDNSEASSWYAKMEITNQLSDAFSQRLAFSKTAEVGFGSNYYDLYHLEYGAEWKILQDLSLSPTAFYEHYKTSGTGSETADRYGTAIGLRYILTPSITLGADYRFILKNSNLPDADYRQNVALLSMYYTF